MAEHPNGNGYISWQTLGVAVGIVVGLGGFAATVLGAGWLIYGRDQESIRADVSILQNARVSNAYDKGRTDERVESTVGAVALLDQTLQREMRLLDDATNVKVSEVDRRPQGELQTLTIAFNSRFEQMRTDIREMDTRVRELIRAQAAQGVTHGDLRSDQ